MKRAKRNTNPKIAETLLISDWDYKLNNEDPKIITTGSDKKVWWKCKVCKLSYDAVVHIRFNKKKPSNCPYCAKKRASYFHNLESLFPKVSKMFDVKKNKTTPNLITPGSHKVFWWKCSKGHFFQNSAENMTKNGDKETCRFCSGKKAWKGESFGDLFPELLKQIDKSKNKNFDPYSVVPGSHKSLFWICDKGHKWKAQIYSRTLKGHGCKICKMPYSKPEIRIFSELSYIFNDVRLRYKFKNYEVDIFLPEKKIAIEYDGYYWHKNKTELDQLKTKKLNDLNVEVFRLRENLTVLGVLDISFKKFSLDVFKKLLIKLKKYKFKKEIDFRINESLNSDVWKNEKLYKKILSDMPAPPHQESLEGRYPLIKKKWDYLKNYPVKPSMIFPFTDQKYWFKCNKGHSYDDFSYNVIRTKPHKHICPFCMGKRIDSTNSLNTLYPKIAKEWDFIKNHPLKPTDVSAKSYRKVWWVCKKKHSYDARIVSRVNLNSNCPFCYGRVPLQENTIEKLYPEFCKKIIKIIPTSRGTRSKSNLNEIGIGSHVKVYVNCIKCDQGIINEVRRFIEMIKRNSQYVYICKNCR